MQNLRLRGHPPPIIFFLPFCHNARVDRKGHGWLRRKNIAENFNSLSRVDERYRRQTDGGRHYSEVRYNVVVRLSVCLSSVTFVRPTQAIEIFGNVFTPRGTLAIRDLCIKILR